MGLGLVVGPWLGGSQVCLSKAAGGAVGREGGRQGRKEGREATIWEEM